MEAFAVQVLDSAHVPDRFQAGNADATLLPKSRDALLVGTMSMSFDESTYVRQVYPPPPAGAAYLTNMAVDGRFRRKGVASQLLLGGMLRWQQDPANGTDF